MLTWCWSYNLFNDRSRCPITILAGNICDLTYTCMMYSSRHHIHTLLGPYGTIMFKWKKNVDNFIECEIFCCQLLGELLLDRHNFTIMTRYISNPDNLKLMMNMLREKSRNIQFEGFHVFKVSSWQHVSRLLFLIILKIMLG